MHTKRFLILIIILALIMSCDEPSDGSNLFSVSGIILQKGVPVSGVKVSIDNKLNYTSETDTEGAFLIEGVPEGDHNILMKSTSSDGSYSESSNEISLYQDLVLNSLVLPAPVQLETPTEVSGTSMNLTWTPSDALDFREYKIYRHLTSGIDETTGTLVHVTISRNDTSFTDTNLDPLTEYYYRVFVMNDVGRVGGSNVASAKTQNLNLIYNGDFEINEEPTAWWVGYQFGTVINQEETSYSGDRALYMNADSLFAGWDCYYATVISPQMTDLEPGKRYRLSLWIKTEGFNYPRWGDFSIGSYGDIMAGVANYGDIGMFGVPANTDWTYIEKVFDMTEYALPQRTIQLISSCEHTWVDDIRLELVE